VKWIFFIFVIVGSGCYHLTQRSGKAVESKRLPLLDSAFIAEIELIVPASVHSFYASRQYSLIWSDTSGLKNDADSLLNIIRIANYYGLIPEDYHLAEFQRLLNEPSNAHTALRLDALLTDSFFALRHHLKYGRLDEKMVQRKEISQWLDSAGIVTLNNDFDKINILNTLETQEPSILQYQALRDSLQYLLAFGTPDSISIAHIQQLTVNLERLRLQGSLPSRYIYVNIPSFEMKVLENDSLVLQSKVIIGKPETPTPVLSSVIKSFVIYPYWHVPRGIAVNEILPAIRKDSTYLASHNFDVLDANGNRLDSVAIDWLALNENKFPYTFRQREGTDNSLGTIKFWFESDYSVFLHDTNSRRLFNRMKRALSHGCVRVHKAVELAHYLVRDDHVYVTPEDVDQYLNLKQRIEIRVRKPISLFIQYVTCEYKNGMIQYYEDIYGKDTVLINILNKKEIETNI
jgi:murein L,D-transpeptidase YcbB/YkuD